MSDRSEQPKGRPIHYSVAMPRKRVSRPVHANRKAILAEVLTAFAAVAKASMPPEAAAYSKPHPNVVSTPRCDGLYRVVFDRDGAVTAFKYIPMPVHYVFVQPPSVSTQVPTAPSTGTCKAAKPPCPK